MLHVYLGSQRVDSVARRGETYDSEVDGAHDTFDTQVIIIIVIIEPLRAMCARLYQPVN